MGRAPAMAALNGARGRPFGLGGDLKKEPGDGGRNAVGRDRRGLVCPVDRGLGTGPPGHAGRHRRGQCRHGGPGRRRVGLPPAAAHHPAHSDALYGPGTDRAARRRDRPRSWRTDPGAVRPQDGVACDAGAGRRRHRLAHHRVHRRRRGRRIVRPLAGFHASFRRGGAARHRRQRVVQAGRADGAHHRPLPDRVLHRRLGRASGAEGAGAGRDRLAPPQSRFSVHGRRRSSAPPSTRG